MDVSIIIVNYNTKELTLNCLKSIYQYTKGIDFEIILVDNASTDESVVAIEKQYPNVVLIKNKKNLGFGRANNLAVKKAMGKFLFFLNTDTEFIENSLNAFCSFYTGHPELNIGVLGCILLDVYRKPNGCGSPFPTIKSILKEKFRMLPLGKKIFPLPSEESAWYLEKPFFEIDYVIGADMFMSKQLFLDFGGFDEKFFMYYEETDLQLAIRRSGLKNYVFTGTRIIHSDILYPGVEKIKPAKNNWKRITIHQSQIHYLKKNFRHFFWIYKMIDYPLLFANYFNRNYERMENDLYVKKIKKEYLS